MFPGSSSVELLTSKVTAGGNAEEAARSGGEKIAACVCQLSVTIAKSMRQEKIIMRTRAFVPSQCGRFKDTVAPFCCGASWLQYIMVDGVRRGYVGATITSLYEETRILGGTMYRPLHQPSKKHPREVAHELL